MAGLKKNGGVGDSWKNLAREYAQRTTGGDGLEQAVRIPLSGAASFLSPAKMPAPGNSIRRPAPGATGGRRKATPDRPSPAASHRAGKLVFDGFIARRRRPARDHLLPQAWPKGATVHPIDISPRSSHAAAGPGTTEAVSSEELDGEGIGRPGLVSGTE